MSYKLEKTFLSLLIATVMICVVSCSKTPDTSGPDNSQTPTTVPDSDSDNKTDEEPATNKLISTDSGSEGEVVYKVTFYTVDTVSKQLTQSVSAVKGGASLEPIKVLELVADSLEDSSVSISFDGAYFDQRGYCIIEFNESIKEISLKDPVLETLILDACGQSILDNIDSPGVIVRIGDEAYVTDQYKFDKDQVYMDM